MAGCNGCGKTAGELRLEQGHDHGIIKHREPILSFVAAKENVGGGFYCCDCRGRAIRRKFTF